MDQIDHPTESDPLPVIGYAEPLTRPRRRPLKWLAENWLFLCVKIFLLTALAFVGGTVGSLYIDLSPPRPWQGHVDLRDPRGGASDQSRQELQTYYDLMAVENNRKLFHDTRSPYTPTAEQRKNDVRVSPIRSDGSFSITVNARNQDECYYMLDAYEDALERKIFRQGQQLQVRGLGAHMTRAAESAPMLDAGLGGVAGFLIGLVVIRISSIGFRKASTPRSP